MRHMQAKPQRKRGPSRGLVSYSNHQTESPQEEEDSSPEESKYTEEQLLALTNAKLKEILATFDGAPSGGGKNKAQLVSAILEAQG